MQMARQGERIRNTAAGGWSEERTRRVVCKCGHLVGNQFSALPFICGSAFAPSTRGPPVERPLQFLLCYTRRREKERGKEKRGGRREKKLASSLRGSGDAMQNARCSLVAWISMGQGRNERPEKGRKKRSRAGGFICRVAWMREEELRLARK